MNFIRLSLIAVAVILMYYVISQYTGGVSVAPTKNDGEVTINVPEMSTNDSNAMDLPTQEPVPGNPADVQGAGVDQTNWDGLAENQLAGSLSKQYQELTADELLPQNDMANWADIYPSGVGQLQNKNFLHAGHHVGINTVGQSLKNANYQLRSEPANPQVQVSPWMQSSFGPDLLRRPLEIGSDCY